MTTTLMQKAIIYLRRLEPEAQDQLARCILEEQLVAHLSDAERREIRNKLAVAAADFGAKRYTQDGETFWQARLMRAKGMRVIT